MLCGFFSKESLKLLLCDSKGKCHTDVFKLCLHQGKGGRTRAADVVPINFSGFSLKQSAGGPVHLEWEGDFFF